MTSEAKANALADVAAAHVAFKETVRGIPEERLSAPMHGEWSAKDLIAHVSSWNEHTSLDARRIARGHVPCIAAFREADVNEWNAFLMRPRKLFPAAQVMAELDSCYDALAEALAGVPEAKFEPGNMLPNLLAILVGHYGEHGRHIKEWREGEGI